MASSLGGPLAIAMLVFLVVLDLASVGGFAGLLLVTIDKGGDTVRNLIPVWIILLVPLFLFCYVSCRYKLPFVVLCVCTAVMLIVLGFGSPSSGPKTASIAAGIVMYFLCATCALIMTVQNPRTEADRF